MKSARGVPITVLTPPQYKTQAKKTAETVAHAVDFFEEYLDCPYPFEKLDVMGIYDFNAGGMENIGMIHTLVSGVTQHPSPTINSSSLI